MDIKWSVRTRDIRAVQRLLCSTGKKKFVRDRLRRNVTGKPLRFSRERFWRVMMGCLMTTQQKSGPDSPVARFMRIKPFPLRLLSCSKSGVRRVVRRKLSRFGGIRMAPTIAKQAAANYKWLEAGGWKLVAQHYDTLWRQRGRAPRDGDGEVEMLAARFIDEHLKGFGPKQARNLWQWLGITRNEIPLDGRITKWLNENVLGLTLNSAVLGDRGYYEFVLGWDSGSVPQGSCPPLCS
jgi:hypothetical protein